MEGSEIMSQTSETTEENKKDILKDFQTSFFTMSRLASFPWTFLENDLESNKSSELISDILKQTCLHSLCQNFPPSVRYRRLFLSELIRR
ncbi:protein-lysine N-methyltransferase EEF2KMT, partial [Scomber scombrus]